MKAAFISDIHANATALQLVLDDIAAGGSIEKIYCLGDIVGFHTAPVECIELVRNNGIECLGGNHDAGVAGKLGENKFPRECWEAIEWTRAKLNSSQLRFLEGLPFQMMIARQFRLMHGMFENVTTYLVGTMKLRYVAARTSIDRFPLAFYGHTHAPRCYQFMNGLLGYPMIEHPHDSVVPLRTQSTYLVNPGSIGQPRTADHSARYCVFDTVLREVTFKRIRYDYNNVLAQTLSVFPGHEAMYQRFAAS
ncbi:MAG TPA: metallophosphoesterase family protein [Bacteroidota bacterium]